MIKPSKDWVIIFFLILTAVFVRSIHFPYHLNFSTDQASHAARSLEIFRNKEFTLIGPSISFNFIGRELFTGSIFYYFQLIFLLLGNFDPFVSSYFYMLFSALMIIPLYFGVKMLSGKNSAIFLSILYSLLPFYIDFSRFLWNPNFQFSLTPILILFIGLFAKYKKSIYLFLAGLTSGILLLFHYQYFVIILGLIVYYLVRRLVPRSLDGVGSFSKGGWIFFVFLE